MGWEDRQYYRDRGGDELGGPLGFLLNGSVPLFTFMGIRVRAHIWLLIFIGLTLLTGGIGNPNYHFSICAQSMVIFFGIVLLHEFGHCFAGRWVGGDAEQIVLTPLGGLAMVDAPRRPLATLITVAAGPAVNVLICAITALAMHQIYRHVAWNPLAHSIPQGGWSSFYSYLFWIYTVSLALLIFNLLPIFPLDGGQLLQSLLWFKLGYYRATMISCIVGIVGGILLGLLGIYGRDLLLICIAASGLMTCFSLRRQLREVGPESEYATETLDFSASLRPDVPVKKRRKRSRWTVRRLRRQAQLDVAERQRLDSILAKVSAQGLNSLTWSERRALRRATEKQRQSELEFSRRD